MEASLVTMYKSLERRPGTLGVRLCSLYDQQTLPFHDSFFTEDLSDTGVW